MRPRRLRRLLAFAAFGAILAGTGLGWGTGIAKADDINCQTQFWWIIGSTQRTICDGPIFGDGSWMRAREFWTPAHQVPAVTNCFGSYYVSCTTTGGYFQPRTSKGVEVYPVRPETVLPDEPGHIGGGTIPAALKRMGGAL